MPRIAIVACTGGAGHLRAAEGLVATAQKLHLPVEIASWDVLAFTPPWFGRLYAGTYHEMVNRTPELWGYLYERSERQPHRTPPLLQAFDRINYERYWRAIQDFQPDVLLCTHFLPYLSIAPRLRRQGRAPLVCAATTDFDVHRLWINECVDRFYVFHEESKWLLASKGVDAERITVAGIPLLPAFTARQKPPLVRRRLGLAPRRTTILVVAGGFGMGRIVDVARTAVEALGDLSPQRFNLAIVCGRNADALDRVRRLRPAPNVALHPLGFVNNMHEWMDAADLLVSKSGGLTSSEALAKGLPMLVVDPIPGQETRNADLMIEHGAAWKAIDLASLSYKLRAMLLNPATLRRAGHQARALSKPAAAETILRDVLGRIDHERHGAAPRTSQGTPSTTAQQHR